MTGAFVRVKRGDHFCNIEIEHCTDEERAVLFKDRSHDALMMWLNMVCNKLSEVEIEHFTAIDAETGQVIDPGPPVEESGAPDKS